VKRRSLTEHDAPLRKAAMQTVEIPREAWARALTEFTAIHEGWLVSLDVLGPTIGAQAEINNLGLA
jgi:hypothetical protein